MIDEPDTFQSRAAVRRQNAKESTKAGAKSSNSSVYERKWKNFKAFCMDEKIQEDNGNLYPERNGQPSTDIIGKTVEYFHLKIVDEGCDPGEAINIRSALASIYKRNFHRIETWKVIDDGTTEGMPTSSIVVSEAVQYYKTISVRRREEDRKAHFLFVLGTCPEFGKKPEIWEPIPSTIPT